MDEGRTVVELQYLQRDSALISILSLMEGNLNRICSEFEICLESPIKLKDLSGKGSLDNYWNFFVKIIDVDIGDMKDLFRRIKDYYYLRNRIIHEKSIFKDAKKAKEFELRYPELKIYEDIYWHKFYIKDEKFLFNLIEILFDFFAKLYMKLSNRIIAPISIFIDSNTVLKPDEPIKKNDNRSKK
ncbi:hypothetical protein [uncultured Algibacter sp.]|uniref:hypothetical protein n=1 Tax=uncultured Algibacter sp. TaxID=298659 RepID=UPI00260B7009|nr:hypothetical protein [uncultured Algibacter sp.]